MKKYSILLTVLLSLLAVSAHAAQLRVYVADMNAIGAPNRDEMKATLQSLLSSRLTSDRLLAVGSAAEADAIITGTYISIGKVFSIDAMVKGSGGNTITRAFVQGDNPDELIPAVGKLADKLSAELAKQPSVTMTAPVASSARSDFIKNEQQVRQVPSSDFIKPREIEQGNIQGWVSKRLDGVANFVAVGKTLADGSREIFMAEDRRLAVYHQGHDMRLVAETADFKNSETIIALDTVETGDATVDIYLTIIRDYELASQVWQLKGDKLVKVAEGLPYYFRSVRLAGGQKKLYAQAMGRENDYYGDVAEAVRTGAEIVLKNPIKMPRFANIYNFNQFKGQDGALYTVTINPDNYLVVYDRDLKELWRSNDKFGGSELFFQREDAANIKATGETVRWIFLNQRIQVTSKGEVLVGKNDGFWVLGNARKYKKGAVYCLVWNGSSLEEKWRTRETQNYMPDYYYDEARNELMILQTVQRSGISARGASSLSIKRVE